MRILIIEDETRLADTLADIIGHAGYQTDIAGHGLDGLLMAMSGSYDAIVLDVMLPGMDGFQILRQLRSGQIQTPVLMLTARAQLEDRIRGLDCGADYYLTKPFENQELLACLRAVIRRQAPLSPDSLSFGDLRLTPSASQLCCEERQVTLSSKELELMTLLMQNSSRFLSKETLLTRIWGYDSGAGDNNVEAYVSFLRKKLALLQSAVRIQMARGIGYRLEEGV